MPLRLPPFRHGHHLHLLEGSAELFPALQAAFDAARHEIWLETYIFDFTGATVPVAESLLRAAQRGVSVHVVVDGFGTPSIPDQWRQRFEQAGVGWQVYSPVRSWGVVWPGSWRRLHRKLCVVDAALAFCGGINLLDDLHDPNHGTLDSPRLDFAVQVRGHIVGEVRHAMQSLWLRMRAVRELDPKLLNDSHTPPPPPPRTPLPGDKPARGHAKVALLLRDNLRHRRQIETAYLRAIGRAQHEVIIANAYFVPGGRVRRALVRAARRGVKVRLLLQGRYEYFMQYYASRPVYDALLRAGVEIHEYSRSFLHAKVAVFDSRIATVGSSNLDPLSLLLAREANVMVDDPTFAVGLRTRLLHAIGQQGEIMDPALYARRPLRQRALEYVALGVMRVALAVQGKKYL